MTDQIVFWIVTQRDVLVSLLTLLFTFIVHRIYKIWHKAYKKLTEKKKELDVAFPSSPQSMSNKFLTFALQEEGTISYRCTVKSHTIRMLDGGVHAKAAICHLEYEYDGEPDDPLPPSSVVLKMIHANLSLVQKLMLLLKTTLPFMPAPKALNQLATALTSYKMEARFYTKVGKHIEVPLPTVYWSHQDYYNVQFMILMEDLSRGHTGEPGGYTVEESVHVLENLAHMHGSLLNSPALKEIKEDGKIWNYGGYWFGPKEMSFTKSITGTTRKVVANFGDALGEVGGMPAARFLTELAERLEAIHVGVTASVHKMKPKTLIHGDYKLSNLFLDRESGRVVTIDWQWLGSGNPAADVAHYIVCSHRIGALGGTGPARCDGKASCGVPGYHYYDRDELRLLRVYHAALQRQGLDDDEYPFDVFEQQYVLNVVYFTIFWLRHKWGKMTLDDMHELERNHQDGLPLRNIDHMREMLVRARTFVDHIDRPRFLTMAKMKSRGIVSKVSRRVQYN